MSESPKQPNPAPQQLPWNVAVTFNPALGWPILRTQTQTQKMSPTGAVICSDYGDLNGAKITLILESPPDSDGQTIVLRVRARVTSSEATQQRGQYRHDVVFARAPGDRYGALDQYFGVKPQAPAPEPSHLDKLKALAQQKLIEEQARQQQARQQQARQQQARQAAQGQTGAATAQQPAKQAEAQIEKALQQTYDYFKELVEQLNVLKPEFPRQYAVPGVPEFRSLRWDGGRAHGLRGTQVGAQLARLERVALNYVLSGGGPIRLEREYPASDRLKTLLNDYKIAFTAKEQYNARGSLERVNFEVPLTVDAGLQLTAKLDEGKIQINATHIGGFGVMRRLLAPEAITQAALHELSGFILGETSGRLPRLLQGGE